MVVARVVHVGRRRPLIILNRILVHTIIDVRVSIARVRTACYKDDFVLEINQERIVPSFKLFSHLSLGYFFLVEI